MIDALPAWSVTEVLRAMAGEDAHVTLHLSGGHQISGVVCGVDGAVLVRQGNDVTYVVPRSIEAVAVLDAPTHAGTLSSNQIAPTLRSPDGSAPPTKLELRRKCAAYEDLTVEVDWDSVSAGEPMRVLARLMDDAVASLRALLSDPLATKVSCLRFRNDKRFTIEREETTVTISAPLDFGSSTRSSELEAALESVL